MIKSLFTVSLLCLGAAVSAQTPAIVGKVAEVQGVVTISNGLTVGTAVPGTVITEGNRFVTASAGAARLTMDNGCVINLKPNESLVIDSRLSCRELLASIQSVGTQSAAVAVGGGAGLGKGLAGVGGLLLAGAVANSTSNNSSGTPVGGGGTTPIGGGGGGIPVVPISGQ